MNLKEKMGNEMERHADACCCDDVLRQLLITEIVEACLDRYYPTDLLPVLLIQAAWTIDTLHAGKKHASKYE